MGQGIDGGKGVLTGRLPSYNSAVMAEIIVGQRHQGERSDS